MYILNYLLCDHATNGEGNFTIHCDKKNIIIIHRELAWWSMLKTSLYSRISILSMTSDSLVLCRLNNIKQTTQGVLIILLNISESNFTLPTKAIPATVRLTYTQTGTELNHLQQPVQLCTVKPYQHHLKLHWRCCGSETALVNVERRLFFTTAIFLF